MMHLATLAALHARLMLQARDAEAIAARGGPHAEREAAEAQTRRAEADALADLLALHGLERPAPGQLQLFGDGTP